MGRIFSGLVQTGAWGCFDEFNRIDVEVLSVVSSQLQTIQNALNLEKTRFEFLGKEINIKPSGTCQSDSRRRRKWTRKREQRWAGPGSAQWLWIQRGSCFRSS